jgi:ribose transport system substrate-binding protein
VSKRWIILIACSIFIAAVIGCAFKFPKKSKPKVVVVLKDSNNQYWKIVKAGAEKAFNDFGIDGKVLAPEFTYPVVNQINILEQVLKEKPNALIFAASQPSIAIPVLKKYKKNHIPVLLVDSAVDWDDQTAYIGTDNPMLGKKAGELLGSMLQPSDKVVLIGGSDPVYTDRIKGAKEVLEAVGIEVLEKQLGYDEMGKVKSIMENILQHNPEVKGVFAANDLMALDVLKVITQKDLKITVIGADGIINMLQNVETGDLISTVAQNPYDMGYISVENALKAIKGEKVQKKIDTGVDIISKDNASDRLKFLEEILARK